MYWQVNALEVNGIWSE